MATSTWCFRSQFSGSAMLPMPNNCSIFSQPSSVTLMVLCFSSTTKSPVRIFSSPRSISDRRVGDVADAQQLLDLFPTLVGHADGLVLFIDYEIASEDLFFAALDL